MGATGSMDDWLRALAARLEVTELGRPEIDALLDLARDAAHGVARPAAPLTCFLAGVAVGRGADLDAATTRTLELLRERTTAGRPE